MRPVKFPMRLSLSVNNGPFTRASLEGKGWLGAHVSLSQGMPSEEPANRVFLRAMDLSGEPNTVHMAWNSVPLTVGDRVQIELLPDGEYDPPDSTSRTSDSPNNLFSTVEQARFLLAAIKVCDRALWEVAERASGIEPPDELQKIRYAIGSVLTEIDQQLISPTLRKHPELLPLAEELNIR